MAEPDSGIRVGAALFRIRRSTTAASRSWLPNNQTVLTADTSISLRTTRALTSKQVKQL